MPLAYFITFHTYGSWLHGEKKGSIDKHHNRLDSPPIAPDEVRRADAARKLQGEPVVLDKPMRPIVDAAIRGVCEHRGWELLAVHVRTNHVHVVVIAPTKPETIMTTFKIWATRRLVEAELVEQGAPVWSRHGSTRRLFDREGVDGAVEYTLHGQGPSLG